MKFRSRENILLNAYSNEGNVWHAGFETNCDREFYSLRRPNNFFGVFKSRASRAVSESNIYDEAFYAGVLFPYFGHFVIESLDKLEDAMNYGGVIIYHTLNGVVKDWQVDFFKALGVYEKIVFVKEPVKVKRLYTTDQKNVINSNISYGFVDWASSLFSSKRTKDKIYISRSLCENAPILNEKDVEAYFRNLGYRIVHPENLSLLEQISLYNSCSKVASIEGSALHTLLFCNNEMIVDVIARRRAIAHNFKLQFSLQYNISEKLHFVSSDYADSFKDSSSVDLKMLREAIN